MESSFSHRGRRGKDCPHQDDLRPLGRQVNNLTFLLFDASYNHNMCICIQLTLRKLARALFREFFSRKNKMEISVEKK